MNEKSVKIKTTGQLREFLTATMEEVKSGLIDLDKAGKITKLAGQINESFYAEIKVSKIMAESGQDMISLGELPINKPEKQ